MLLQSRGVPRTPSLQAFQSYREAEANSRLSVSKDGAILEWETLQVGGTSPQRQHPGCCAPAAALYELAT